MLATAEWNVCNWCYTLLFKSSVTAWLGPCWLHALINSTNASIQIKLRGFNSEPKLNLTSTSKDRFAKAGFFSQHRQENMLTDGARVRCWRGEKKMAESRRGGDVTYLRLRGWGPSLPFFSLDSRVYFQIHCHGCSSPPGGPPLTNQLPAHLPAGQRPSVAHRWSLPLPAHRGQDQQGNLPSFVPRPVHTGKPRCHPQSEATQKSLFGWPHYFSQGAVTSRRL